MINRIERPLANDHPDGSFSVHLFLHRPKTQISRIIGQYTHNLLGLKTLSFALLLIIHKIWIKGPQIRSDMPSALGLVQIHLTNLFWTLKVELVCPLNETFSGFGQTQHLFFDCLVNIQMVGKFFFLIGGNVTFRPL